MQYDEAGAPKEDRIAENRLRRRRADHGKVNGNGNNRPSYDDHDDDFHNGSHDGSNSNSDRGGGRGGRAALERGDTVFAPVDGRGQERAEATVEAYLGDDLYRVSYCNGSGTKDLESHKLRCANPACLHCRKQYSSKEEWSNAALRIPLIEDDWTSPKAIANTNKHVSLLSSCPPPFLPRTVD